VLGGLGAVVTGGGRGIGAAVARRLSEAGASVVLAARTKSEIEAVADEIRALDRQAWAVACDLTDEGAVRRLGKAADGHLGSVDILAHCAGEAASAPFRKITLEDWDRILAASATSAFLCAREFVPGMVERGGGRAVFVASFAGLKGARYVAHYAAAKHAVIGLVRSLALEVEETGVAVAAVCPGYVDTDMTERTLAVVQEKAGLGREEALAAILGTTGQTRLLTPDEVAGTVLALCAGAANEVDGRVVVLNPGSDGA
jgi:NAD(P)-dependent dehydrogenase (short-subunit alcohol dehydrogenase family)